ncbi:hypothetical protein [Promicromonospora sp. NPDC090134]|uniref:hypothetical protein n=1 Tax=Promicromonospora sp. NPDC090134 TaxID=3364408 RepID=UPI00381C09EB
MSTDTAPEKASDEDPSGATSEPPDTTDETVSELLSEAAARAAVPGAAAARAPSGAAHETSSVVTPEGTPGADEPGGPTGASDEPADRDDLPPAARPLTAALLNLSGLGLGYLHLRAWVRLAVALAATAGLAWVALPIGRDPIAVWWAVGYVGALALFALDAALLARRRARRAARRRTVWSPRTAGRVAWATLAVVPLLAAGYVVTQHEVLEQYLAYDLDQAQESLEGAGSVFGPFRDEYDAAYATYVRTADEHPGTRAADRVPGLVDDLYAQAKGKDACNALTVVRHFAEPGTPGPLQGVAEADVPGALHDCGIRSAGLGQFPTAKKYLTELLVDHPVSDPAAALPGDLKTWRDGLLKDLAGKDGCDDTVHVTGSTGFLAGFDSGKVSALADEARKQVPAGLLRCGVQQLERRQYAASAQNLAGLLESYPRAKEAQYAERVQIAAGIALVDPKAGVKVPARDEPEGTITLTVYNYSPDEFEMVYTGPATGVVEIEACDDCEYVPEGDDPECSAYSLTHPSTTVTIPKGDYITATRSDGVVQGWLGNEVDKVSYTASGGLCTWTYEH